jgi:uncharacterized protein YceH (UPF0502 family)
MDIVLSPVEIRVLGSLVEKELTTPEYYPLTLNSAMLACNQKSNRDPVMNLAENDVRIALETLCNKNLAWHRNQTGNRVPKFEHNLTHKFSLAQQEVSVLCVLMLRGPCTPGELRVCTGRMYAFKDLLEVEQVLQHLSETSAGGPFVVRLPREPGRKEHRFMHLFGGEVSIPAGGENQSTESEKGSAPVSPSPDRVAVLEEKVAQLMDEVTVLKQELGDLKKTLGG